MKKILKRIFLGLFAVIIIAGSVGAYLLFHGSSPAVSNYPYITDNEGNSYLAVVGEDGVTYAVVTDANGNRYAAQINSDNSIGATVGNVNEQVALDDLPTNYTGEHIDVVNNLDSLKGDNAQSDDPTASGSVSVTEPSNNASQNGSDPSSNNSTTKQGSNSSTTNKNSTTSPLGENSKTTASSGKESSSKLTAYRIEKYQNVFKSGTYLIEFETNDPETGNIPITFATKNGNFVMDTDMDGIPCKAIFYAKDKSTYVLIDGFPAEEGIPEFLSNIKMYVKMPDDMVPDDSFDVVAMTSKFIDDDIPTNKIKVETKTKGGKKLICESYTRSDGTRAEYYFDGDNLVRIDEIDTDATTDSIYISRITTNVPDSTFEIPKGYKDYSWLFNLAS